MLHVGSIGARSSYPCNLQQRTYPDNAEAPPLSPGGIQQLMHQALRQAHPLVLRGHTQCEQVDAPGTSSRGVDVILAQLENKTQLLWEANATGAL